MINNLRKELQSRHQVNQSSIKTGYYCEFIFDSFPDSKIRVFVSYDHSAKCWHAFPSHTISENNGCFTSNCIGTGKSGPAALEHYMGRLGARILENSILIENEDW